MCASSHMQVQCCPPLWQLHSDFKDFNDIDCHDMKISTACSPGMALLTQQTLCFSPHCQARDNKPQVMSVPAASDWGQVLRNLGSKVDVSVTL